MPPPSATSVPPRSSRRPRQSRSRSRRPCPTPRASTRAARRVRAARPCRGSRRRERRRPGRPRPSPGTSSRELFERAEADVDACGGQDDVVQRARDRVRRLAVERQALLVERAKAALVLRQRPSPAAHALPGGVGLDLDENGQGVLAERLADLRARHRPTAQRNDLWRAVPERLERGLLLAYPELGLAPLREDLRDRRDESDAEPQHQDRHHGDLRDRVEADHQRIDAGIDRARPADREAEQQPEADRHAEADQRGGEREQRVAVDRRPELDEGLRDQRGRRQEERRDVEDAAPPLPRTTNSATVAIQGARRMESEVFIAAPSRCARAARARCR